MVDDLIGAGRVEGDGIAVDLDGGFVGRRHAATDADVEDLSGKAEALEELPDRADERLDRGLPHRGQRLGVTRDLVEQGAVLALAPAALRVEAAQTFELGDGALAVLDDRCLIVTVASLERVDRRQPFLERPQRVGIVVDGIGQVPDLCGNVRELRLETLEPGRQRLEPSVQTAEVPRLAKGDRGHFARTGAVGGECLHGSSPLPGRSPRHAGRPQAGPDLVGLPGSQPGRGDLGGLVLEEVDPSRQIARFDGQLGKRRAVRPPALHDVGHARTRRGMTAEGIEQVALPAFVEQALLLVLAVDLDERTDLFGEPRGGRGEIVQARG